MAYSKMRWISTPTFLACVWGAHGREEGVNGRGGGANGGGGPLVSCMRPIVFRMHPLRMRMRPSASVCTPPPTYAPLRQAYAPLSQSYAPLATPTIQRGSDVAATVDKVSPDLPYPRSTRRRPLSDGHEPYRM
jgi:hypothetical protein